MHGEGAKRMWKPFWKEVVGENDVVTSVYSRKIVYMCDQDIGLARNSDNRS